MRAHGAGTDSRSIHPGNVFIALNGDRFDGHRFLNDVCQAGAGAVVVETGRAPTVAGEFGVIEVADTKIALGRFAAAHRAEFEIPVIAVAGSNGKTTTKDLIGALAAADGLALWSEASFNNDIGVPLTLLKLTSEHKVLVQELGTNHPGELKPLIEMTRPLHGVITSIGREHLEHFGDIDGVLAEEGTLAEMLPPDGILFLNGDDAHADDLARRSKAKVVRIGSGSDHDWQISNVQLRGDGTRFNVDGPNERFEELHIRLLGRHQVTNAVLALAVGTELGLSGTLGRRTLAACTPPKWRLQLWEENGVRVLDDCYNANADSMTVAIDTLAGMPCSGRRIAVLGDMGELGQHAESAHREIGRLLAARGVDMLLAVGSMAYLYAGDAREAGMRVVSEFDALDDVAVTLQRALRPGDLVLIKASRSAGLEKISAKIRGTLRDETTTEKHHEPSAQSPTAAAVEMVD